jgi:hypothetical protein
MERSKGTEGDEVTNRQRKEWRERFIQMEIRMLNYYRAPLANNDPPDGSFFFGAFIKGWDAAIRSEKKRKGGTN